MVVKTSLHPDHVEAN